MSFRKLFSEIIKPLTVVSLLCSSTICHGQYYEYHILTNDRDYYHPVGPKELVKKILSDTIEKDSIDLSKPQPGGIIDGVHPVVWLRNEDAPDGIYYIYGRQTNHRTLRYKDTLTLTVIRYENHRPVDTTRIYDHKTGDLLEQKTYFLDGSTREYVRYRYGLGNYLGGFSNGWRIYPRHYYPLDSGAYMVNTTHYDSLFRVSRVESVLFNGDQQLLLFDYQATCQGFGFYRRHYFLNEEQSLAQEIRADSSKLVMKKWCEDGHLYFHLEGRVEVDDCGDSMLFFPNRFPYGDNCYWLWDEVLYRDWEKDDQRYDEIYCDE